MTFDDSRGVTVLCAGYIIGRGAVADTWEWDGVTWRPTQVDGPTPRYVHAMAYDQGRRSVILFGGHSGSNALGDTWEYRCDGGRRLPPPVVWPPIEPGADTRLLRFFLEDGNYRGQRRSVDQINWELPTVMLFHGWNSNEWATWITTFIYRAFEQDNGILRDIPNAQVVVVSWPGRASPQWEPCELAWLSGRNGYADGLALGAQLVQQVVDPLRIHLVGHSNGSAFAAGVAQAFLYYDGRALGQLTVLDAPSETGGILDCPAPPTGWIVQQQHNTVARMDSWTVHQGQVLEYGDLFTGNRIINFQTDFGVTSALTRPWHGQGMTTHSMIPIRYALSTDKRLGGAEPPYSEPGAFASISVLVRPQSLPRATAQEDSRNRWRQTNEWRMPGLDERSIPIVSPSGSWRGFNAWAEGSEFNPVFRLDGSEDLYVEFMLQAREGEPRMSRLTWKIEYLAPIRERLFVYADDQYVMTIHLDGDLGRIDDAFSLLTNRTNPVKIGLWMRDEGYERSLRVFDLDLHESDFVIVP